MTNTTPGFATRRSFFKLTGALGLAAGVAATISACGGGEGGSNETNSAVSNMTVKENGTITAGISYELGTNGYDPMTTTAALTVAANWHTMEGLTELHPATRECYPALGAELPQKVDDTTYTVKLRDGAVFADGTPVTIQDVVFSFNRVIAEDSKSLYKTFVAFLDSVEATDETTVTLKLKYAFSLVAERISVIKIVPQAAVEADATAFDLNPIGTGAYTMTDNGAAGQQIVFERNDRYTGKYPALAAKMVWNILPDNTTRTNAITSGAVQAIDSVPAADLANMKTPIKVAARQGFNLVFAMFNNSVDNPMADVRNRQAVLYALDYEAICTSGMSNLAAPATCFVHKDHPAYKEAHTVYTYDVDKAKALIAASGLTTMRVLCSDHGWWSAVRPIIRENLEAIGLTINFEEKKSSDVYDTIDGNPAAFDVVFAPGDPSVFGNDADLLLRWWYAADVWTDSRMHWKGTESYAKVHELLDQGITTTGDEQIKIWQQIFDEVSDQVPLYPVFHRQTPTAYDAESLSDFAPIALTGLSFVGVGSAK